VLELVTEVGISNSGALLHPDSKLDVPYMFFDCLDKRNAMVKSIPHFDNFTKWTILVGNTMLGPA